MHLPDAPEPYRPPPIPHAKNVTCGRFVPGNGCFGAAGYETLIVEWSTEERCRAACEAKAKAVGDAGCCWHTPVQRNASSCEWITNGHHDTAGAPTIRSAVDCTGTDRDHDGEVNGRRRRNLRTLQLDSHRRPQHCPAQQPGTCQGTGVVSVSQHRKVAELAATVGLQPPQVEELNAMGKEEVDRWLAQTLAAWLSAP